MDPDPRIHRRTLKRIEHRNHARSLTFSCFKCRPFLRSTRACQWTIEAIRRARSRHPIHLWAYCIMPTHVHLLVYPTDHTITLGPVLTTIKQSVTKRARLHLINAGRPFPTSMTDESPGNRRVFRFWQRGAGYDRNITNADTARREIRYIHRNPVEAGLCVHPLNYEWSSARTFKDPSSGPLPLDLESLPRN